MKKPAIKAVRYSFAVLAALLSLSLHAADRTEAPEAATGLQQQQAVVAKHAMVVAANPLAVAAGVDMLRRGGSAVDAAIAVQMVLALVEPQSSGVGGGSFLLYYRHDHNRVLAYDGRETAPAAATADMFLDDTGLPVSFYQAVIGGKSVGVPGTLRMLALAHAHQGKLPWRTLFGPAIKLAERGFIVSPRLHALIARDKYLPLQAAARAYFYHADGTPLAAGERLVNPQLAKVLRQVAQRGVKAFYTGKIARDMVATVHAHPTNPGRMSLADLAGYRAKLRTPVCGGYRAYIVCGMPPPSSGGVAVLQILGMLESYDVAAMPPESTAAVHLISEAERLAFADRNVYLADDDFVNVPVAGLLDKHYLQQRASLINPLHAMGVAEPGIPPGMTAISQAEDNALELPSTSHISIVDRWGNAVSMTSSIEDAFGSRHMVDGFLLNNELTDFSFAPEQDGKLVANRVQPGKRPRSSMAPTLIFDRQQQLVGAIGSPGGSSIINYVTKALVGVLDWHLDIQQAVALPNFGSRNGPTELEQNTALETLQPSLQSLGHTVKLGEANSGLHGIMRVPDGWMGGVDPRREGMAVGY
ncbi:gamma-glutamyltransferase [Sulfuriferula thiophila]|uniref:gamma-glutamyltransferase n=1 Tax=Sulfuriferula thiophila TaxID=1781211 RepID=UPI000F610A2C|nr:gamma-glutamyltransferase [Sulfuriferula thiophila]